MSTFVELIAQLPLEQREAMRLAVDREVGLRLEEKVVCHRRLLDLAQEGGRVGIFEIDMGNGHATGSSMWARLLGQPESATHLDRQTWVKLLHPDDREHVLKSVTAAVAQGCDTALDYRIVLPDGSLRWLHSRNLIEQDDAGRSCRAYGTLQDITERKILEADILHRANHDSLTNLPNRRRFMEELSRAFEQQSVDNCPVGVVLFDLDDLKPTNDHHGHQAGDALIVAAARRLGTIARHSGMAARIGGDEFALLLTGRHALRRRMLAERSLQHIQRRVRSDGTVLRSSASAGGALHHPGHISSPALLLRRADTALYVAKNTARGGYCEAPID